MRQAVSRPSPFFCQKTPKIGVFGKKGGVPPPFWGVLPPQNDPRKYPPFWGVYIYSDLRYFWAKNRVFWPLKTTPPFLLSIFRSALVRGPFPPTSLSCSLRILVEDLLCYIIYFIYYIHNTHKSMTYDVIIYDPPRVPRPPILGGKTDLFCLESIRTIITVNHGDYVSKN